MNKHSHLEFAFLTNFYNGSMSIKRAEYPLCSSISKTIYLCSIISISHFLIFFNLFCVKKENSTCEKSSFVMIQLNPLQGIRKSVVFYLFLPCPRKRLFARPKKRPAAMDGRPFILMFFYLKSFDNRPIGGFFKKTTDEGSEIKIPRCAFPWGW